MTPGGQEEQALVNRYEGLVYRTTARYQRGLPDWIEYEDMCAVGRLALLRAIREYDPARGTGLQTWAINRIRWAVLDWLRRLGEAERKPLPIPEAGEQEDETASPWEVVCWEELIRKLRALVRELPDQERLAVETIYFEDEDWPQVLQRLHCTARQAVGLRDQAVQRLRERLGLDR